MLRMDLLEKQQNNETLLQHLDKYEHIFAQERQQTISFIKEKDDQNIKMAKLEKGIKQCDKLYHQYQEIRLEYNILLSKYNTLKRHNISR